jgi:hypothetical protein
MRSVITIIFALFTFLKVAAQSSAFPEMGVGVGASIYQGDLNPHWIGAYDKAGFSFQIQGGFVLNRFLAIRANYTNGYIRDNEEKYTSGVHRHRNFSFETPINELSAVAVVNPQFSNGYEEVGNLHPYFFAGAGITFLNIKRDWSRFNRDFPHWQSWVVPGLLQDSMQQMPTAVVTFPIGAGLRYQIGNNVAIFTEFTKRITRNEYLDGFSKSANRKENDGFGAFIIGLSFRLYDLASRRGGYGCPVDVY